MIVPDANLLLYAHHQHSNQYEASRKWLEATLSGDEAVGLGWQTIWAFLRISTTPRIFDPPFTSSHALSVVSQWLERQQVTIIGPGEKHWAILSRFISEGQCAGPLVMDAVLAAIVVEHGGTLYSTDRDFSRFPGLEWRNPLNAPRS